MFDRIAWRYDLMNGLMTFGRHQAWRRRGLLRDLAAPEAMKQHRMRLKRH